MAGPQRQLDVAFVMLAVGLTGYLYGPMAVPNGDLSTVVSGGCLLIIAGAIVMWLRSLRSYSQQTPD